ncbi:MAG: glycosyltransferase [Marinilabiliaceae bacterium]|nr:glycosyltransferase [Marinilabiliaceae bacterium]
MVYLASIVFIFALLQLANATINLVFYQRLVKPKSQLNDWVSILIPARNEEKNIGILLASLQQIKYQHVEILVYDDQSTDRTAAIVNEWAASDQRIRLIRSTELKPGWLGKNHACYTMAQAARGAFLLFIDADVTLSGTIVEEAVHTLKKQKLGLLSFFPKQLILSSGEKVSVPIMNYILLTLLPLIFVRHSPFSAHAAANGQFMLFDASIYNKFNPHLTFKNSPVEDISIARHFKKNKVKVSCMLGDKRVSCRMYTSYREALNGFSKNVLMFFGNQTLLAILFWSLTTLGFIFIASISLKLFFLYTALIVLTRVIVSIISRQHIMSNILFIIPQHVFLLHVISNALMIKRKKNYTWKERKIY